MKFWNWALYWPKASVSCALAKTGSAATRAVEKRMAAVLRGKREEYYYKSSSKTGGATEEMRAKEKGRMGSDGEDEGRRVGGKKEREESRPCLPMRWLKLLQVIPGAVSVAVSGTVAAVEVAPRALDFRLWGPLSYWRRWGATNWKRGGREGR